MGNTTTKLDLAELTCSIPYIEIDVEYAYTPGQGAEYVEGHIVSPQFDAEVEILKVLAHGNRAGQRIDITDLLDSDGKQSLADDILTMIENGEIA